MRWQGVRHDGRFGRSRRHYGAGFGWAPGYNGYGCGWGGLGIVYGRTGYGSGRR